MRFVLSRFGSAPISWLMQRRIRWTRDGWPFSPTSIKVGVGRKLYDQQEEEEEDETRCRVEGRKRVELSLCSAPTNTMISFSSRLIAGWPSNSRVSRFDTIRLGCKFQWCHTNCTTSPDPSFHGPATLIKHTDSGTEGKMYVLTLICRTDSRLDLWEAKLWVMQRQHKRMTWMKRNDSRG